MEFVVYCESSEKEYVMRTKEKTAYFTDFTREIISRYFAVNKSTRVIKVYVNVDDLHFCGYRKIISKGRQLFPR